MNLMYHIHKNCKNYKIIYRIVKILLLLNKLLLFCYSLNTVNKTKMPSHLIKGAGGRAESSVHHPDGCPPQYVSTNIRHEDHHGLQFVFVGP